MPKNKTILRNLMLWKLYCDCHHVELVKGVYRIQFIWTPIKTLFKTVLLGRKRTFFLIYAKINLVRGRVAANGNRHLLIWMIRLPSSLIWQVLGSRAHDGFVFHLTLALLLQTVVLAFLRHIVESPFEDPHTLWLYVVKSSALWLLCLLEVRSFSQQETARLLFIKWATVLLNSHYFRLS